MNARLPFASSLGPIEVTQLAHEIINGKPYDGTLYYSYDFGVEVGTEVLAVANGTVHKVVNNIVDGSSMAPLDSGLDAVKFPQLGPGGIGNQITIYHEDLGLYVTYAHLAQGSVPFEEGQVVSQGTVIGVTGLTGTGTGPHLHITYGTGTVPWGGRTEDVYHFTTSIANGAKSSNPDGFSLPFDEADGQPLEMTSYVSQNTEVETPYVYSDSFDDGVLNTEGWTYLGTQGPLGLGPVLEANGYLEVRADTTDNYERAELHFESSLVDANIEMTRYYHPNNDYFFGGNVFNFTTADGNGATVSFSMLRSSYPPDYLSNMENFDRPLLVIADSQGGERAFRFADVNSSTYFDTWVYQSVKFDNQAGTVVIDVNGDGEADIEASDSRLIGASLDSIGFDGYGWFTGHYTRIDDLNVSGVVKHGGEAGGSNAPVVTQLSQPGVLVPGEVGSLGDLLQVTDPQGAADIDHIRVWDSTPGTDGGYLTFDNARVTDDFVDVARDELGRVRYVAGPNSGTNSIVVEAFDKAGHGSNELQIEFAVESEGNSGDVPVKVGGEFLVNTTTLVTQEDPTIAALSDGRFVVAWEDYSKTGGDRSISAIRAQVFNANGTKAGDEILVNTTTQSYQSEPTIIALSDGGFAVAWEDNSEAGDDTSGWAIRAQRFNANGTNAGDELLVNTTTEKAQRDPVIAALSDGRFVVAWTDESATDGNGSRFVVRAQVFNANGTQAGSEFLVGTPIERTASEPSITTLTDGRFVVAWKDSSEADDDTSSAAVRAQVFSANGTPAGDEFLVNTTTEDWQGGSTITALSDGRFVVAWIDSSNTGGDISGLAVRAQIFSTNGSKVGAEFLVNTTTHANQDSPVVTALADGRFVVVWEDLSRTGSDTSNQAIRAQVFDANGSKAGGEFLVNTTTQDWQGQPTITALSDSRFVVAWSDYSRTGGNASGQEILAQIFEAGPGTSPAIDTVSWGIGTTHAIAVDTELVGVIDQDGINGPNPQIDKDWYRVTLQGGTSYTFGGTADVSASDTLDSIALRLYRDNSTAVSQLVEGSNPGFTFVAPGAGTETYYLAVSAGGTGDWMDKTGAYALSVTAGGAVEETDPAISGGQTVFVAVGTKIMVNTLISVTDPQGSADVDYIRFWDTTPGTDGGYLTLNNEKITGGFVHVTLAQLDLVHYQAGTASGTNSIIVEAFDKAGNSSGDFQIDFTVGTASAVAPVIARINSGEALAVNSSTPLNSIFQITDPQGASDLAFIRLLDPSGSVGGFTRNGFSLGPDSGWLPYSALSGLAYETSFAFGDDPVSVLVRDQADHETRLDATLQTKAPTPITDDLLEYFARSVAYDPKYRIEGTLVALVDGWKVDKAFVDDEFVAIGLKSTWGESVLAFRGTTNAWDWKNNFSNFGGAGQSEFVGAWNRDVDGIREWVANNPGVNVTGHSQGGAQAQMLAATAVSAISPLRLGDVVTFNSAGVSSSFISAFESNPNGVTSVRHLISANDIVSLTGTGFISGAVERFEFDAGLGPSFTAVGGAIQIFKFITNSHTGHWSNASPYEQFPGVISEMQGAINVKDSLRDASYNLQTYGDFGLNSGFYSPLALGDTLNRQYFGFLYEIAQTVGSLSGPVLRYVSGPAAALAFSTRAGVETLRDVVSSLVLFVEGGIVGTFETAKRTWAAVETAFGWGAEAVGEIVSWTVDTWTDVSDWTAQRWSHIKGGAVSAFHTAYDTWENLIDNLGSSASAGSQGTLTPAVLDKFSDTLPGFNFFKESTKPETVYADQGHATAGSTPQAVLIGNEKGVEFTGNNDSNIFWGVGADKYSLAAPAPLRIASNLRSIQSDVHVETNSAIEGAGNDFIIGVASTLDGSVVSGFSNDDGIFVAGAHFSVSDMVITKGSAILEVDVDQDGTTDFTMHLLGNYDLGAFQVEDTEAGSMITYTGEVGPTANDDDGTPFETSSSKAFKTGSVLTNDEAFSGDFLQIVGFDDSSLQGLLSYNGDGTFTYDPNGAFDGLPEGETATDSFTYNVVDETGIERSATVTLTIVGEPENTAPIASDGDASTDEDASVSFDLALLTFDADDNVTSWTIDSVIGGSVTGFDAATGTGSFVPDADFNGPAQIDWTVTDAGGLSDAGVLAVDVTPVADPPVDPEGDDAALTLTTPEDTSLVIAVAALLADDVVPLDEIYGPALHDLSGAVGGSVQDSGDGTITFTPDADFNGEGGFYYRAQGEPGAVGSKVWVPVTVTPVNDAPRDPESNDDALNLSTAEDTVLAISIAALLGDDFNPADEQQVAILEGLSGAVGGTVTDSIFDGDPIENVYFRPFDDFHGEGGFFYTARDDKGAIGTPVWVSVTVTPVNDAPLATDGRIDEIEDFPGLLFSLAALANDVDGDPLTFSIRESRGGTVTGFDAASGFGSWVPHANFNGAAGIDWQVSDGQAVTDGTYEINIASVNDAPVFVADAAMIVRPGQETVINVAGLLANDTDADGDVLAISQFVASTAQGGTVQKILYPFTFAYLYTPANGFLGTDTFSYVVSDGFGGLVTATLDIEVENSQPVAQNDGYLVRAGQVLNVNAALGVLANDTDADGDAVRIAATLIRPENGTVSLNVDGSFIYTPNAGFAGTDSFLYSIRDGFGGFSSAQVFLDVRANSLPQAVDDSYTVRAGQVLNVDAALGVLSNDTDADGDAVRIAATIIRPENGSLSVNVDGSFIYTPNAGFAGTDSFLYSIRDGFGGFSSAQVRLSVEPDEIDFNLIAATPNQTFLRGTDAADALVFNTSRSTQAFGGEGADVFVFLQAGDGKRDTGYFRDFEQGVDLVDVGDAAFTLRVVGTDTVIRFSAADRDTLVVSDVALTAADFTTEWSDRDLGLIV